MKFMLLKTTGCIYFINNNIRLSLLRPLMATLMLGANAAAADTNVNIQKGDDAEFTIISDKAEVAGEPLLADADARESWKKACEQWKAEMRDLNKDNQLIALSCGTPRPTRSENANTIYRSDGTYKVRVRVRHDSKTK